MLSILNYDIRKNLSPLKEPDENDAYLFDVEENLSVYWNDTNFKYNQEFDNLLATSYEDKHCFDSKYLMSVSTLVFNLIN